MEKVIFMAVLIVFGLALFSGCASIKGETTGEYIGKSTMTTKDDAIIVNNTNANYSKIDVTTTQRPECSLFQDRCDDKTR